MERAPLQRPVAALAVHELHPQEQQKPLDEPARKFEVLRWPSAPSCCSRAGVAPLPERRQRHPALRQVRLHLHPSTFGVQPARRFELKHLATSPIPRPWRRAPGPMWCPRRSDATQRPCARAVLLRGVQKQSSLRGIADNSSAPSETALAVVCPVCASRTKALLAVAGSRVDAWFRSPRKPRITRNFYQWQTTAHRASRAHCLV
jgi:hypothetical protein